MKPMPAWYWRLVRKRYFAVQHRHPPGFPTRPIRWANK